MSSIHFKFFENVNNFINTTIMVLIGEKNEKDS